MRNLEKIGSLYSASPNAYLILLPDAPRYTIVDANEAFLQLAHISKSDIVNKGVFEAFPENPNQDFKAIKATKAAFEQVLLLKKPYKSPVKRFDLKRGEAYEVRFWSTDTFPLLNEDNEVEFLVQSPVDVTSSVCSQNEQSTTQLYEPASFFENPLINHYPDAIFSMDLNGNFLSANQALLDLAECSREELLQLSFVPFIAQEDFDKVFGYFQSAVQGIIQNFEARVISAKGTPRVLTVTNMPIVVNQEVIGIHVIAKDITALKTAEQQVEAYNRRISNILESITDGFFAVDRDWTVTYWNKEAERLMGICRREILGRNLWEAFPGSVGLKFYSEQQRAMAGNTSVHFEELSPTIERWIEVSAYPSDEGLSIYFKDITERKQVTQQLNHEKEKYESLFNLSPIPKWVYDRETLQILDVNAAAIKHYGYSREEFLSMTILDIRPADDQPMLKELHETTLKTSCRTSTSLRHVKKNGRIIDVTVESNAINFVGKKARFVVAIDITEKLEAERALEASEQRFKALVQEGSDLIAILDKAGNYQYVSPTSRSILGIEADFFVGKNAFDFIHEDDRQRVLSQFALLGTNDRIKISPFRFLDGEDQYRWIETIVTDMTQEPAVQGIVANSRDVTKRIESEIKTDESIKRFNTVSKATSDAIYDWDMVTNEILWNRGIKGIFGHRESDLSAFESFLNQIHPEDLQRVINEVEVYIERGETKVRVEYRLRCADGTYKAVLDRGFLIYDQKGQPVRMVGAIQDITDRVNYIRAIEDQNKRLQEISWVQSHQLRAPLATIMGLTDLLCEHEPDEKLKNELLSLLKHSTADLDTIIRDILKIAESTDLQVVAPKKQQAI